MGLFTQQKIERAIRILQEHEPEEGYYLAFSGGKDSIVIYDLVVKSGVKFQAYYNVTTVDPPELLRFIKKYYPNVIWEKPKKNMLQLIEMFGTLPTRRFRYCCQYLKEVGGVGRLVVDGIRRQESTSRSHRKKFENDKKKNKRYLHIIIDWSHNDVWEYIHQNELPYCELYDEGYTRIGCIACPFRSGKQRKQDFERYPYLLKAYKNVLNKIFDKYLAKHFNNVDEYLDWWLSDKSLKVWKEEKKEG